MASSCRALMFKLLLLANRRNLCSAFVARHSIRPATTRTAPRHFVARASTGDRQRRRAAATVRWSHPQPEEGVVIDAVAEEVGGASAADSDDDLTAWLMEKSEAGHLYYMDAMVIGAGAAGVGIGHALLRGGMEPSKILLVDRGPAVGHSFRQWHANATRFISPSWAGYPFGVQDLNACVPDTTVGAGQHPTGNEYADYLERMVSNGTVPLMLNTTITSVERIMPQGCFVVKTDSAKVFIANYVVWCGGEWHDPRRLATEDFPEDASVHYKDVNIARLLDQQAAPDDNDGRIVLVGGGEAGADLGVALARQGARVLIVEGEDAEDDGVLDPSRNLSPVTQDRLASVGDRIEYRTGTRCIGATRAGDVVTVSLQSASDPQDTEVVRTGADVVLCTGFDPSRNPLMQSLFSFSDAGNPEVTPEHDESTRTPNLFLAGPMLVHEVACGEQDGNDEGDGADGGDDIIFCFVYKYRTRFAVVASEIIRRHVIDQRLILDSNPGELGEAQEAEVRADLDALLAKRDAMTSHYASRGMLLTDLSCAQLACGMSANDVPDYGYAPACACAPGAADNCETC